MTGQPNMDLALKLLSCDSESEVVELLTRAGYWNDERAWRLYGDTETNYATIGNQQSRPEAALAEKIVNSVDARLLAECYRAGVDPASKDAPQSISEAVARFIEKRKDAPVSGGHLKDWSEEQKRTQARFITLAVTGATPREGSACLTIVDRGEGQSPRAVPDTFLSINRNNKLRIPFVQGKFNMGGTGALKFCGKESIQLLITRRDPEVLRATGAVGADAGLWSFTVVRRERPVTGAGKVRNSVYRYLAPVESTDRPNRGDLLTFDADAIPALPERNIAYTGQLEWGAVIKLYEYDMKGFRSHALMGDGLLSRLELLLPGIALPVRVHECRDYGGEAKRSFENSLVGLMSRLQEGRSENLEDGYPTSLPFKVRTEEMVAQVYAFKEGKAESYTKNEGIIFVINGQTHGSIPRTFFERKRVRMQRLAKSLLVVVDCSSLSVGAREDLFMNSRDRLTNGELRKAIEDELEDAIGQHQGLRRLQDERKSAEIAERLAESKPLEDVLGSILKSSPSLARLFLAGQRLSKPHRQAGDEKGGTGGGEKGGPDVFVGKTHPTYFRFSGKDAGAEIARTAELGRRCRIKFETDVENNYFSRADVRGKYHVEVLDGPLEGAELDHNLTLHNGVANWSISLPEEALAAGDEVTLACTVSDQTLVNPFVNVARVRMTAQSPDGPPGKKVERGGSGDRDGSKGAGSPDAKGTPEMGGLALPNIIKVRENDSNWKKYGFDEKTGCHVIEENVESDSQGRSFTFYVNVDNIYIRTDMKAKPAQARLVEAKFVYGNVLTGLALIHDQRLAERGGTAVGEETSVADRVGAITRALSPFVVPMIDNLGSLTDENLSGLGISGDDD